MIYIYLALFWVIDSINEIKQTNKDIISNFSNISCNSLPYWVQEKLEQTYENITSFKCTTNP